MDFQIAQDMRMSLKAVKEGLAALAARSDVVMCYVMRFEGGKKVEGYACRASGYIPPAAPGRKPKGSTPAG